MTVRELIVSLATLASVHGDDFEVVASPGGDTGLNRWVTGVTLSGAEEPRVVARLTLGDAAR